MEICLTLIKIHSPESEYDLLPRLQENFGNLCFPNPIMLISQHINIGKAFDIPNDLNNHVLTAEWTIEYSCPFSMYNERYEHTKQIHLNLKEYSSFDFIDQTYNPIKMTHFVKYKSEIYIQNGRLVKHLIIGVNPSQYKLVLLFHFYADWKHAMASVHLWYLSQIQSIFGKIIISCVHDNNLPDSKNIAEKYLRSICSDESKLQITHRINNKRIGESVSFRHLMLEALKYKSDYVFYAHSKGMRHTDVDAILHWVTVMYHKNIAHLEEMIYSDSVFMGCFRSKMAFDLVNRNQWHYSGSYYWVALENLSQVIHDLFYRSHDYYVSERFPSTVVPNMNKCIDLCDIRIPPSTSVCPFYNTQVYRDCLPYFYYVIVPKLRVILGMES